MDLRDNCTFRIYQETDSIKVHLSTLYYNHISAIVIKYAKYIVFLFQPYHSAVCTNELNWGLKLYLSTVVTADCSPSCPGDGFVCWRLCFRDRLNNCWCKNPAPGCSLPLAWFSVGFHPHSVPSAHHTAASLGMLLEIIICHTFRTHYTWLRNEYYDSLQLGCVYK